MSDEPRRVLIGTFPAGMGSVHSFGEDVGARLIAEAAAKLTAERDAREAAKAEAERLARSRVTVDRAWFLSTMRAHIALLQSVTRWHDGRGNYQRGDRAAWKARELQGGLMKMSDDGPIRAYVGSYPIARDVTISAVDLQRASDEIDAERQRRAEVSAAAQARAEAAKQAKSWRSRLGGLWRRWNENARGV